MKSTILDQLMYLLINVMLFIVPFVFAPWSERVFEIPRVIFFTYFVDILLVLAVARLRFIKPRKFDISIIVLVVLFVIWSTFTALIGVDSSKSFLGNAYRLDGLLTLYSLCIYFFVIVLYWRRDWTSKVLHTYSYSSVILGAWSIIEFIHHPNIEPSLSFGHKAFLASYLCVTLPFLKKWQIPIVSIAILTTRTMSGIIGLLFFVLFKILNYLRYSQKKIIVLTTCLSIILASMFLMVREPQRSLFDNRERIFMKAVAGFSQRPIVGWGWANFDYIFRSVDWPIHFQSDIIVDKAHSSILEVLTTTGIVGFILYASVFLMLLSKLCSDPSNHQMISAVIIYMIIAQTNIGSITQDIFYWTMLGIISSSREDTKPV